MSLEHKLNSGQWEKDLEILRKFRLLDDDFMTKVFEERACAELLVQIILGRSDLSIHRSITQREIKNLQGRSIRLDILAIDSEGHTINLEVQRNDKGAGYKRARYHSSLLDANMTDPGDEFSSLGETYIVFITENDVLGGGLPIYHIDRRIRETDKAFADEAHIIYVNSQIQDETALGRLMHDFSCRDYNDMHYDVLADRVRYFKENEEGVMSMCKAIEDMRNEAAAAATAAATRATRVQITMNLLAAGVLDHEAVAGTTGLTLDEVEALAAGKSI